MTQDQYLQERLIDQFAWYDAKAGWNQKRYRLFKTIVIILSVFIPLGAGFMEQGGPALRFAVGTAGALVAIFEGISSLNKYQEKWTEYRRAAEYLKRERLLFETQSGPYRDEKDPFRLLVERVETFTAEENQQWAQYMQEKKDG
ncbi:MAG: DUF4231 domain-containing protein [Lewinellaceae bacterium]|nr:DUF4231 domain-containing protein [Lewinellaceae bacterium]